MRSEDAELVPPGHGRAEAVFDEGAKIFDEIAALCEEQREALARRDLDRLDALAERAETLGARFRLLECARPAIAAGDLPGTPSERAARERLAGAAARAAVAASGCADLLARSSAATAALQRVLDGAQSAGYLPTGETPAEPGPRRLERTA